MDPQPDVIRQQIEETRSSLTDKLETLEAEVKGTVQSARETVESAKEAVEETLSTAKETVQDTISSVKETVHSAKETVKRTFDIPYQVDRHPWGMMGLSLVAGAVAGVLVGRRTGPQHRLERRRAEAAPAAAWSRLTHEETPARPGFMDQLTGRLAGEVEKAKELAITTAVGIVDNVVRRSIPQLGSAVEDMLNNAASSFGAPPQYGEERRESYVDTGYQNPPKY